MNNNQNKMNQYQAELLNNVTENYEIVTHQVDESLGSLFTKDDVKKVLDIYRSRIRQFISETELPVIEETPQGNIDFSKLKEGLSEILSDALDNNVSSSDFEVDNQCFTINYNNQVELEDYEINPDWSSIAEKIEEDVFDEICKALNCYEAE